MPEMKKDSPQQSLRELKERKERRSEEAIDQQLEKDANEMAEKAGDVQKRNEEDRGIFTK
jgi:hypothetical protein